MLYDRTPDGNSPAASHPRPPHPRDARSAHVSTLVDDLYRAGSGRCPDRVRHLYGQLSEIDPRLARALMTAAVGQVGR